MTFPFNPAPATGVRLQKLDDEDAIAAVALVPPALQDNQEGGQRRPGDIH